jgi:15-cis-phytoene synthase/lycopene beta-cyclase
VIQTYTTTLLYLILSLPTAHPTYLRAKQLKRWSARRIAGQLAILTTIAWGWWLVVENGTGAYTGLILVWAGPFLLLLW